MEKKVNNNLCLNIDVDENNNNNKKKKKNIKKRNYKQTFCYNQNNNKIIKDDSNIFNDDPLFNLIFKKKAKKSYDETFSLSDKSIETQMTQSDEDQNKCKNENNNNYENNF